MGSLDRDYDLILWGATGFTGQLTAEVLLERYGVDGELRWALAGRNRAKLEATRAALGQQTGVPSASLPLVLADANDPSTLQALAARTRVVCTTVGPYALYGSELVAACAERGTHYCDLTGEAHWMRRMIDAHHKQARVSAARIVFTCGFDCIPSDLGTLFMQNEMLTRHGVAASEIKLRVKGFSGGASGGTIASMINMMEEAARDPEVRRVTYAPYSLNPQEQRFGPDGPEPKLPAWDPDFEQWTAPFVMGVINTKVVRRSHALLGQPWGAEFRYSEAMLMGTGPGGLAKATGVSGSMAAMMGAMALGPVRHAIAPRLPAPGEGPSRGKREAGYFDVRLFARHPSDPGKNLHGRVVGDRDPGYGSTSRMLAESAACLALDGLSSACGISTPAVAMGEALLVRLQKHAGLVFTIES